MMKTRILFLCTANSARSQMAEGLLRRLSGDLFEVASAGTDPGGLHPLAVEAMAEQGIDISNQESTSVQQYAGQSFDYVVTVCDRAREVCPNVQGLFETIHWGVEDPAVNNRLMDFKWAAKDLKTRLGYLILIEEKRRKISRKSAVDAAKFFKCLADETRLRCLVLLQDRGALCVCDLAAALELSQPKISRHLAQLRACELVSDHREGQWVFYRLHSDLADWQQQVLLRSHGALMGELPYRDDLHRLEAVEYQQPQVRCPA